MDTDVPKPDATNTTPPTTLDELTAAKAQIADLQAKLAALPTEVTCSTCGTRVPVQS